MEQKSEPSDIGISELYCSALETDSIEDMVRRCAIALGNPFCVIDATMRHIAHYPLEQTGDADWDSLIKKGYVDRRFADIAIATSDATDNTLRSQVFFEATDDEMPKYRSPVVLNGSSIAGTMLLERDHPFTEHDRLVLEAANRCIANVLMKDVGINGEINAPMPALVRILIHDENVNRDYVEQVLEREGHHPGEKYVAFYAPFPLAKKRFAPYWG